MPRIYKEFLQLHKKAPQLKKNESGDTSQKNIPK